VTVCTGTAGLGANLGNLLVLPPLPLLFPALRVVELDLDVPLLAVLGAGEEAALAPVESPGDGRWAVVLDEDAWPGAL
jgi:hypothetical protein